MRLVGKKRTHGMGVCVYATADRPNGSTVSKPSEDVCVCVCVLDEMDGMMRNEGGGRAM